jgi:AraC-like DNA-binding protein
MKLRQIDYDRQAIHQLVMYMQDHCTEPFNAEKHAGVICFSTSKLNKVFKLHQGVGPGTYFRQLRIKKALEMYQRGTTNWTEISYLVGYADLPSFSKAFKRVTGINPKQFSAQRLPR